MSEVKKVQLRLGDVRHTVDQVCRPPPIIAVVDDDPAVCHALSFAFETSGIGVAAYADARSALVASQRHDWRCLILDLNLPQISGLDLLAKLRADGVTAPCILITSHPSRETRGYAAAAGVEIIEKPLLDNKLARKVHELLGRVCC
ncbi:MAG: response regulator [Hyphomonadaceae bacterium]